MTAKKKNNIKSVLTFIIALTVTMILVGSITVALFMALVITVIERGVAFQLRRISQKPPDYSKLTAWGRNGFRGVDNIFDSVEVGSWGDRKPIIVEDYDDDGLNRNSPTYEQDRKSAHANKSISSTGEQSHTDASLAKLTSAFLNDAKKDHLLGGGFLVDFGKSNGDSLHCGSILLARNYSLRELHVFTMASFSGGGSGHYVIDEHGDLYCPNGDVIDYSSVHGECESLASQLRTAIDGGKAVREREYNVVVPHTLLIHYGDDESFYETENTGENTSYTGVEPPATITVLAAKNSIIDEISRTCGGNLDDPGYQAVNVAIKFISP